MTQRDLRHCSFCGRDESEIQRLFGTERSVFIFICDECVDLMHEVLHADRLFPDDES